MAEKYLVTGGAGFIGSHVVERLVKEKKKVRVLDNLSTGFKANLAPFMKDIEFVKGDLRSLSAVRRAVRGITGIFHLAAIRAVARSVDKPLETNEVNVTGMLNLLQAAKDAKVRRLVYSSSSSVYGESKKFPLQEADKPQPVSPYAATKLMGEYYCQIFTRLFGLETVSLRYFNVFGPRQNPESQYSAVIPIFIYHLLKGRSPQIHWDGKQSRDFSYVDNVVAGNILAMKAKGASGGIFNIACHEENSVLDIFNEVKRILGKKEIRPQFTPKRAGDVRRTLADISRSRKVLGFKVQTRFHEGLKKTVNWFIESKVLDRVRF